MPESKALVPRTFVALTPQDVASAQAGLADWCWQKMRSLGKEYAELRANLRVATRNRWSRGGLIKAVGLTKRRIQYYRKLQRAIEEGYLIIPNLPVELLAVRVAREGPTTAYATYPSHINEAKPQLLPAGEGRYVDETLPHTDVSYLTRNSQTGKTEDVRRVQVGGGVGYDETIDFPVVFVKPIIMEATERALSLKIFDQIGVAVGTDSSPRSSARRRRSDPMVIGQIIDPRSTRYSRRVVSFFIAWWLDTDSL